MKTRWFSWVEGIREQGISRRCRSFLLQALINAAIGFLLPTRRVKIYHPVFFFCFFSEGETDFYDSAYGFHG